MQIYIDQHKKDYTIQLYSHHTTVVAIGMTILYVFSLFLLECKHDFQKLRLYQTFSNKYFINYFPTLLNIVIIFQKLWATVLSQFICSRGQCQRLVLFSDGSTFVRISQLFSQIKVWPRFLLSNNGRYPHLGIVLLTQLLLVLILMHSFSFSFFVLLFFSYSSYSCEKPYLI